jgi:hypothetical protein
VAKLRALAELFEVSSDDIALMERDEGLEGKRAA